MKKTISIALAVFMLFSNMGFALNTHLCGGKAVKTSFTLGLHNPNCGMANMEFGCEHSPIKNKQLSSESCCLNQHQVIQIDENAELLKYAINTDIQVIAAFIYAFFVEYFQFVIERNNKFPNRTTLLLKIDFQVFFQTFLI